MKEIGDTRSERKVTKNVECSDMFGIDLYGNEPLNFISYIYIYIVGYC